VNPAPSLGHEPPVSSKLRSSEPAGEGLSFVVAFYRYASLNVRTYSPSVAQLEAEGWEVETRNPYGALMIMRMNP